MRSKCMCRIRSYNLDICTYIDYELSDTYNCKEKNSVDLIIELFYIYLI
jgi:hypothetical protein